MMTPNQTVLYVKDPRASVAFYTKMFGFDPVYASPEFALFILPDGHKFSLWTWKDPEALMTGPGIETAITVDDYDRVDGTFTDWSRLSATVVAAPETYAFGRSFVVSDPDGNRIRVLAVAEDPK